MELTGKDDPRATLAHVASRLSLFGYILVSAGAIVIIQSLLGNDEKFWRVLRGLTALVIWVSPGAMYLLFSYYLPRRRRWTIVGAEVTTYLQLFFAGVLIIVSLLHVLALWPVLLIAIIWIVPLLMVPKLTAQCPAALDLLATQVTLDLVDRAAGRGKK